MTNKEAKKVVINWLKERDYRRIILPGTGGANWYVHSLGDMNALITFYKDRFDDIFIFDVGCFFDDCEYGYATINVKGLLNNINKENNTQGIYFGDVSVEQIILCLNEMFDKYLKPYYDQGTKYLKTILLKEKTLFKEDRYYIAGGAREKINKMFGLNIRYKP